MLPLGLQKQHSQISVSQSYLRPSRMDNKHREMDSMSSILISCRNSLLSGLIRNTSVATCILPTQQDCRFHKMKNNSNWSTVSTRNSNLRRQPARTTSPNPSKRSDLWLTRAARKINVRALSMHLNSRSTIRRRTMKKNRK